MREIIGIAPLPHDYWHFEIPGEPAPWKRKGGYGNRSYNPSADAQKDIAWSVRAACPTLHFDERHEHLKWGVRLAFFSPTLSRSDGDNLQKNFFDALNKKGIAWWDDCQIREAFWIVVPDPNPRTEGVIYQVSDDYLASWSKLR
jgi:Holliday junction resolvase RusA-like endonuclease